MNYTTVEEILMDDSFLAWHYKTDEAKVDKWEQWIKANPEHRRLVNEAIYFLKVVELSEKKPG